MGGVGKNWEVGMKRVLIIDDDPDIREIVKMVLTGRYEIREAGSRSDGQKAIKDFLPDLVVLDVMMERHDSGFEFAREIKNDPQLQQTKILMLTNVDNEMNMDFKSTAGDPDWLPVNDYIVKPIDPKTFLPKVQQLIGG
jgi:two-component system, OmpR family, alkaline phosphatase synthesis response regulator PhoP